MDKFLIAPFKSGLQKGGVPFLEPKDAFSKLNNAYVWRGKVKKRFGSSYTGVPDSEETAQLHSRLRINIGVTDHVTGNLSVTPMPGIVFKEGQQFSIGSNIFTAIDGTNDLLEISTITTSTYDKATGNLVIVGAEIDKIVWFYPAEPVLGLERYEDSTFNDHDTIAFDTQFAYKFSGTYWSRLGTATWTGDKNDYYWTANGDGATPQDSCLYVTNFNTADSIKYYDGATWTDLQLQFIIDAINPTYNTVKTCKIILPYKDRLLFLNTFEINNAGVGKSFVNRCRYSWNGSPLSTKSWYEPNQDGSGGAGYIDAPTEEEIVSAEFIKDSLIVYFENSTYLLAYTGNDILPFVWRKINTELGSQSTFSSIPFDDQVLNIGLTGIHSCNGNSVKRIDSQIPDDIFKILNDENQSKRIHGIRDFISEMVYWSLPKVDANDDNDYPDRVLAYNYKDNTFAYNDDCILTYGYFEQAEGETWENDFQTWEDDDTTWDDGFTLGNTKQLIGGNQQGYVFLLESSNNSNASVLSITNISGAIHNEITVVEHNLKNNDYCKITFHDNSSFIGKVTKKDDDTIFLFGGSEIPSERYFYSDVDYTGGATIERISKIDIQSTLWNPYLDSGSNVSLSKITFCVNSTTSGKISVDHTISSADGLSMYNEGLISGTNLGDNILETFPFLSIPFEALQNRLWHSMYFTAEGEFVKLRIYFSDEQMNQNSVTSSTFVLEAMILETQKKGLF